MSRPSHIVMELGLRIEVDGDDMTGSAAVFPEICVPGTRNLRTSVLATWADVITGTLAMVRVAPRIPLTLDLDVQVVQPAADGDVIAVDARVVKLGRTVLVCESRFRNAISGALIAVAYASFVASPNPGHVFPAGFLTQRLELPPRLRVPLAQRVGGTVVAPGTVDVPRRPDGLNASGAIQGGLVAFAVEEAANSLVERPILLSALGLRYLRPFSVGPARAEAERHGETCLVNLTDTGLGKLGAVATARLADGVAVASGENRADVAR